MKRLICLSVLGMLISPLLNAQLFTRTYGSPGVFNSSNSVAETPDFGYAMFGSTDGWGAVNGDMLLVKTDSSGNVLWNRIYGNAASEQGVSMNVLPDSGFILLGMTNESANGDYDIRVIRTDSLGNTIWSKTLGTPSWDVPEEIIPLYDGGFALTGSTYNSPYENGTFYVIRLDSSGTVMWEHQLNRGFSSQAKGILELPDSSLMVTGIGIATGHEDLDMLLVKYSATGDTMWTKYYGSELDEWAVDLAISFENRICLAGNKTQVEGNTREYMITVDVDGAQLNFNDFYSDREIVMKSVRYYEPNNSFVFSLDFLAPSALRATIYRFTVLLDYLCSVPVNDVANSSAQEAIATSDGHLLLTGTYNQLAPGVSSMLLFKTQMDCSSTSTITTGIEEQQDKTSIKLYPNPGNSWVNLELVNGFMSVQVFDLNGRLQAVPFSSNGNKLHLNMEQLAEGVYLVQVVLPNGISNYHRFIRCQD
jgi:hypothetical protein